MLGLVLLFASEADFCFRAARSFIIRNTLRELPPVMNKPADIRNIQYLCHLDELTNAY